jgi:DNA-binding NarL/FixJ family response regulator
MTALEAVPDGPVLGLAARELEILALMATGLSNSGIAARLCVSSKTIEHYVARILAKLGVDDSPEVNRRVQAVLIYLTARSLAA